MSESVVLVSIDNRLATVTLNRPESLNALNAELRSTFCRTMQKLRTDPEVGCVIITGAGRAFCAGLDLKELGTDGLPFAPFTAMLRDLVHDMGAAAFTAMLPGRATRELARLLPELGTVSPDGEPGTARAALLEEMLSALEQLGSRSPVVLVIEDAHWADRSSRDLLTFLIGNQRAIRGLMCQKTHRVR